MPIPTNQLHKEAAAKPIDQAHMITLPDLARSMVMVDRVAVVGHWEVVLLGEEKALAQEANLSNDAYSRAQLNPAHL